MCYICIYTWTNTDVTGFSKLYTNNPYQMRTNLQNSCSVFEVLIIYYIEVLSNKHTERERVLTLRQESAYL